MGSLRIAFFGHDSRESTIIKRVAALQRCGASVTGFMFKRARAGSGRQAGCPVFDLGTTVDRHYGARLAKLLGAAALLARRRSALTDCDLLWARNIDMLALAVFAKKVHRLEADLVYEVLDVQRVFCRTDRIGATFRWAERALMRHAAHLVVSSPQFMRHHFDTVQNWSKPWHLVENKIGCEDGTMCTSTASRGDGPPWVIGWFGTLRCKRSLRVLEALARQLPGALQVHIRGIPSHEDLSRTDIEAACARTPSMRYFGPYASPGDLSEIYAPVHFAWSIDYLDAGGNSDWLLPNRIYEGGAFGAVQLTRLGTATADYVVSRGFGLAFAEPLEDSLYEFLCTATPRTVEPFTRALRSAPRSAFYDERDTFDVLRKIAKHKGFREDRACVHVAQ